MVRSAAKPRVSNHEAMDARSGFDRTGKVLHADRERCGCRGRLCLARNHLADDVVWVMVAVTPAFSADDISSRLTVSLPSWSSLPKTSSACARLAPPAPTTLSNSDLLILPSWSASIFENRSFSASGRPAKADVVEPIDDWPCAASSAPIVAGDSCDFPPDQGGGDLAEAGPFPEKSKGFAELCPKPVDCGDDGFDDVS